MSVTYFLKKEGITDTVMIPGSEISGHILVKLIADKLGLREHELLVTNPITGFKLGELEVIKDKYSVNVEKVVKNDQIPIAGIVSNEQLAEMASKARFFMIKSSNEENIQKAREHSVWATTLSNQVLSKSYRIGFAQLSSILLMSSCFLPPIDRLKSRESPEWKMSPPKMQRKPSGQVSAILD